MFQKRMEFRKYNKYGKYILFSYANNLMSNSLQFIMSSVLLDYNYLIYVNCLTEKEF